jgi:hypothetical protein
MTEPLSNEPSSPPTETETPTRGICDCVCRLFCCRRGRNCRVRITLMQVRFRSAAALSLVPGKCDVTVAVEGSQQEFSPNLNEQDTQTMPFPRSFYTLRTRRCGTNVEIAYSMEIAFHDPPVGKLKQNAALSETRSYRCPGHVDHEVLKLRSEDGQAWYEFEFDFQVELTCTDSKTP